MEAMGYIFLTEFPKFRMSAVPDRDLAEAVKRYWVSSVQAEKEGVI